MAVTKCSIRITVTPNGDDPHLAWNFSRDSKGIRKGWTLRDQVPKS